MVRFARYWDLIGNSGRFPDALPLLLGEHPFEHFMSLSDWLFATTTQTHRIALPRLFDLLRDFLVQELKLPTTTVEPVLINDFSHNRLKGQPGFVKRRANSEDKFVTRASAAKDQRQSVALAQRQHRHVSS